MEPLIIIISLLLASLILLACWSFMIPEKSKNIPPGPPKLPIIGNIHQLNSPTLHRLLRSLARKYGPIMHLQLGQISTVVVSTPQMAAEIMKTNDINFANRPTTLTSEIFFYNGVDIGLCPYSKYWRQMRKICNSELLSAKRVRSFNFIRKEELTRIHKVLESKAGMSINIRELATEMTNNVICKATMGDHCKDQAGLLKAIVLIVETLNAFNLPSFFPILKFLNVVSGNKARWLRMQKQVDDMLEDVLEEHRVKRKDSNNNHEDLVDVLLRIKESGDLDIPITNEGVKAIILDMLTGGTETSSSTIVWAIAELMKNPEIMKKAQEEVRSEVKGSTVTEEDIQNMHYLKLIIKEALRLHMPGPLLVPRECRQDCKVGGYDIQAKTKVFVNAWACGTDPEYWENPDSFIPERFEKSSISYNGSDFEFIPFGAGRRMCPGLTFGLSMVEYPLAYFLYHFDWKLPNGMKPHELDMTEISGVATVLKHDLHLVPIPKSFH